MEISQKYLKKHKNLLKYVEVWCNPVGAKFRIFSHWYGTAPALY